MLSPHTGQPSPRTSDATLLVLHNFSIRTTDVTLLILQIFSSNCTPCLPIENVAFWCLSLSPHIAQLYPHTSQPSHAADLTILVLHTFSSCIADVTLMILPTFSSNQTPSPPTAYVAILTLHTLSSHCTKFSLSQYCRCGPAGTTHFLYSYRRCDISDTAGFLLTPDTMSFYYRCSLLILYTFSSYCRISRSYCRCDPPGTEHFLTFLIMQTFSSHHTPCPPTADVTLLILYIFSSH